MFFRFCAEHTQLWALTVGNDGLFSITGAKKKRSYKYCSNYQYSVCNWLVTADDMSGFCKACSITGQFLTSVTLNTNRVALPLNG